MKIIHTADLHLDSKIEGLPADKSKQRREEVLRSFEKLADFASANSVRAVIIAGDMFDTSRVELKVRERVLHAIKKNSQVDFIYLPGNHDEVNFIFEQEDLPVNLKTIGDKWTMFDYGNVAIAGIVLSPLNSRTAFDTLSLDADRINVVTLHGQVVGFKSEEKAEIISIPRLKGKNVDYLALGHIHSYSVGEIDNRGIYCYSGCLDGRGFDELKEKGFSLIEIEDKKLTHKFVQFSSRVIDEYEYNVDDSISFYQSAENLFNELKAKFSSSSLIKVVLKGEHGADFIVDKEALNQKLNEYFFFAKVYDKTQLKVNVIDYESDKSVKGEFVRAVWESDLSSEQKNKIIACGLSALKGEI